MELGITELGIWDNWVLVAFLSPVAWAIACLFDVCLIDRRIYRHPMDGVVVSGLFFALPLIYLLPEQLPQEPLYAFTPELLQSGFCTVLAAACYILHLYFYFKTLFAANDVSNVEIFNLLSVLLVPVIAFVLIGEQLSIMAYIAIALAGLGILIMTLGYLPGLNRKTACYIALSVFTISLSMVLQAIALENLPFELVSCLYLLTGLLIAIVIVLLNARLRHAILPLLYRFGPLFIIIEILETSGVLASQRATDLSPSVSLVAVVECALPILIMLFSLTLVSAANRFNIGALSIRSALAEQITDARFKCIALSFIGLSIFTVQVDSLML